MSGKLPHAEVSHLRQPLGGERVSQVLTREAPHVTDTVRSRIKIEQDEARIDNKSNVLRYVRNPRIYVLCDTRSGC
jgi:hypothetical protein